MIFIEQLQDQPIVISQISVREYCKYQHISHIFALKMFMSKGGRGLFARKSGHHVVNLYKINFFVQIKHTFKITLKAFVERAFNWLNIALPKATERHLSRNLHSADGGSLQQQSIHHEQENTMPFLSICVVNGQLFLCPSIF